MKTFKCLCCFKETIFGKQKNRKYCSAKCQQNFQYMSYIENWKLGKVSGTKGQTDISDYIRRYLLEKYEYKCSKCGWCEKNPITNKSPLEVEHINGISTDNREENLTILCPNCHSLTPTYKALNKGNGRASRRK